MTPWESITIAQRSWLAAEGWTAATYNTLDPWQRTGLLVDFKGGLTPNGVGAFLKDWAAGAVDQAARIGGGTGRTAQAVAVAAVAVAAVVYRKEISKGWKQLSRGWK